MSTITLVLWLQNGVKYGEVAVPDRGGVPWDYRLVVPVPVCHRTVQYIESAPDYSDLHVMTRDLTFRLTERGGLTNDQGASHVPAADYEYRLGRRRFHYVEPSGWVPDPAKDEYERDMRGPAHLAERRERIERANEAWRKQVALLEAGAFPDNPPVYVPLPADILLEQVACANSYEKLIALVKQLKGGFE